MEYKSTFYSFGNGGGIMIFIREYIPAKTNRFWKTSYWKFLCGIKHNGTKMANKLFIQLIQPIYPKVWIGEHLKLLSKNLNLQSSKHERFIFVCDFNVGMENEAMND